MTKIDQNVIRFSVYVRAINPAKMKEILRVDQKLSREKKSAAGGRGGTKI